MKNTGVNIRYKGLFGAESAEDAEKTPSKSNAKTTPAQ